MIKLILKLIYYMLNIKYNVWATYVIHTCIKHVHNNYIVHLLYLYNKCVYNNLYNKYYNVVHYI